jgi:hypothetical protein
MNAKCPVCLIVLDLVSFVFGKECKLIKLLIMQFSPPCCYVLPLRSNILSTLGPCSSLKWTNKLTGCKQPLNSEMAGPGASARQGTTAIPSHLSNLWLYQQSTLLTDSTTATPVVLSKLLSLVFIPSPTSYRFIHRSRLIIHISTWKYYEYSENRHDSVKQKTAHSFVPYGYYSLSRS